ncbi:hypothetical protein MRB53_037974 [Persea americana]|nr:hypothetical protein MRB53_037974 [Persea americana]
MSVFSSGASDVIAVAASGKVKLRRRPDYSCVDLSISMRSLFARSSEKVESSVVQHRRQRDAEDLILVGNMIHLFEATLRKVWSWQLIGSLWVSDKEDLSYFEYTHAAFDICLSKPRKRLVKALRDMSIVTSSYQAYDCLQRSAGYNKLLIDRDDVEKSL